MRYALIFGLVAFSAVVGYGIHRNPLGFEKLGVDLLSDTIAVYVTPAGLDMATEPTPGSEPTAPNVVTTQPALPVLGPASASALPVVTPLSPAPAAPKPQYAVGYVATLPSATPPAAIPQPAPMPMPAPLRAAQPRAATYPTFTDFSSGLEAARKNHVPLLVLFTGSDWCGYCQMLEREVLSTNAFTKFSSTHFVFVTIDDLRNTPVLDSDKQRIAELERQFNITGFPTLLVLDENEKEQNRVEGYNPGSGPQKVIQDLTH